MTQPENTLTAPAPESRKTAARWVRVSTEEQASEGRAGLQRQYEATDYIIAAHGYELVASFEVIQSGTTVALTPQFAQLLTLVRDGLTAVIVSEVSRLMRVDSWEGLSVLDVFAKHHCLIVANGQTIDFSNPAGWLAGGVSTLVAAAQRMELIQKISASKLAIKRRAHLASGEQTLPCAVRYCWETRRYSYDQNEIWRVQKAYQLIDGGQHNLSAVSRAVGLNRNSLRIILANPIFGYGVRRYDQQRDPAATPVIRNGRKLDRPKVRLPPDQVIEVKVIDQPAVAPEVFERVNAILEELRFNHVARLPKENHPHLCTTYGRCGFCGRVLYVSGNGKHDPRTGAPLRWYCCRSQHPAKKAGLPRCSNSWISTRKLDALLTSFCAAILSDVRLLSRLITDALRSSSQVVRPFAPSAASATIQRLRKEERRLIAMCRSNAISIAELKTERQKIDYEIQHVESAIEPLSDTASLDRTTLARLIAKGATAFARAADARTKKSLMEQIFAEVFFRHESITAFRLHAALTTRLGKDSDQLREVITLVKPFRVTPEIPAGHKQCTACSSTLPLAGFPPRRSRCRPCFKKSERERRERAKVSRRVV